MKIKVAAVGTLEGQLKVDMIRSATRERVCIDTLAVDLGRDFSIAIHIRINDREPWTLFSHNLDISHILLTDSPV